MVERRPVCILGCLCMMHLRLSLHAQDQWSSYGTMEPDCATAIKNGSRKMGEMKLGMNRKMNPFKKTIKQFALTDPCFLCQWVSITFH